MRGSSSTMSKFIEQTKAQAVAHSLEWNNIIYCKSEEILTIGSIKDHGATEIKGPELGEVRVELV